MNKTLAAGLVAVLTLSSCGGDSDPAGPPATPGIPSSSGGDPSPSPSPSPSPAPGQNPSPSPTPSPTPAPAPAPAPEPEPGVEAPTLSYAPLALTARFDHPSAIASDAGGTLYVTDRGSIRRIGPDGEVRTLAGVVGEFGPPVEGGQDGAGSEARFNVLTGITVANDGNLYVTDVVNTTGKIRRVSPEGVVTTILRDIFAQGVTADGNGNIYYTDNNNGRVGVIGRDVPLASVPEPRGITIDNAGYLYVTNTGLTYGPLGQNTFSCTIERIASDGGTTTIAGRMAEGQGDTTCGYVDDQGAAARIGSFAQGIAADRDGNLYFVDTNNHTVRRVSASGAVTTIAGTPGERGMADGSGAAARFNAPLGIAMGRDGNLYVADTGNHVVRRVTPGGEVTTVAGRAGEAGGADSSPQ